MCWELIATATLAAAQFAAQSRCFIVVGRPAVLKLPPTFARRGPQFPQQTLVKSHWIADDVTRLAATVRA